jgi:Xaa-Pro aminopeptidase
MRYVTGFSAVDPVVYLGRPRRGWLVVPRLEVGRARRECRRGIEVLSPDTLRVGRRAAKGAGEWAAQIARRAGVRQVRVSRSFPYGVARRLARARIGVTLAKGELFPERAVKTGEEVANIRWAQEAAVIAMRAAVARIRSAAVDESGHLREKGVVLTCEAVRETISVSLLQRDCFCEESIVATGTASADPHERGKGPIRAGTPIVLDIFPRHVESGYFGDLTRTVVRGTAGSRLRKMHHAVKAAQAAALERVKPGVKCATVHRAACAEFERRGYSTRFDGDMAEGFIHGTGHGVGLAVHEYPSLGPGDGRLRKGNVVTVEPGLYYVDIGGVRIEDTVLVTSHGWRYLAPCEARLET